jgi:hypothetical protein
VDPVRQIADAVLYEGYVLWPYRRSALKNRQRWTFGGVFPPAYGEERSSIQAQVLLGGSTDFEFKVRFLQVVRRQLFDGERPVDELVAGGERHISWEEATEREFSGPIRIEAGHEREELGDGAAIVRSWERLEGSVEAGVEELEPGLARVTVKVANETPFEGGSREEALARALCSAHVVLQSDGAFVSATEAEGCENDGVWPVPVGDEHTMLASPIILEDFPRVAPESPGDLFDGGEIDQLLVLNILSLTDEEKEEMRASDPRTREILERTEGLTEEELMALGGRWTGSSS